MEVYLTGRSLRTLGPVSKPDTPSVIQGECSYRCAEEEEHIQHRSSA